MRDGQVADFQGEQAFSGQCDLAESFHESFTLHTWGPYKTWNRVVSVGGGIDSVLYLLQASLRNRKGMEWGGVDTSPL